MRVLVVDDHELVRKGICSVLATAPSLTICGEAIDGQDAVDKAKSLRPDVIVMDISMPRLNGLEAAREIKRVLPEAEIVIVSQHEAPEMVRQALRAGARGYVVKSSISADLLSAIVKVNKRETFVKSPEIVNSNQNLDAQEILQRSAAFELALRQSEERFRSAMNNIAEGLYTVDLEGRTTYMNPSAESMLGWSSAELTGKNLHNLIHFRRSDGMPLKEADCPILQVLPRQVELREHEDVFIRKDGSSFPVILSASPLKIDNEIVGIVACFRDDTKRRQTEEALRQSERIYRAIGESMDFGVWICDREGRNIYTSSAFLDLIGLTQEECSDSAWGQVLHPDDAQAIEQWYECVRNGVFWEREQRFRRRDGRWHHILTRGVPIRDDNGKILYWAGINLDNQHRKETEIALEERIAERTEELLGARNELRELSARLLRTQDEERRRIARELHDGVGQLLAGMKMNFSTLLQEETKLGPEAARSVKENTALVDQALRDIRTMSYLLHPPLLDEIGLGSALRWYLDGFAERSKIAVNLDIAPDLGKLPRDQELSLFRIVQECLTNIHRHSDSLTALVRLYRTPGQIRLEVTDEGKGLAPDVHQKISSGENFGLGLRGIRERLRQFGGRLEIQSNEKGTTVIAMLPDEPVEPPQPIRDDFKTSSTKSEISEESSQTSSLKSGGATILCIDDEATGLLTRRLLLESAGHHVIEANSGAEGLRLFQTQKIDAVVLDYWMSGMKGTAVATELKRLNPSVPIIVLSGLPDFPGEMTGVIDKWLLKGNNRAEHLLDTIKLLLERSAV